MTEVAPPLVSVVMPVYNGERFIADAIRSVLAQTYTHFDMTIVNNRSTDRTLEIATRFTAQDPRIRVVTNTEFLSVVANHNMAFTQVSADAKYAKLISADDWFFPACIEELVRVAEAHPTVGMATSYVLTGSRVGFDGLPYPSTFMTGREVCRVRLLKGIKVFGGPSASLIRADVLRAKQPFYNPLNFHGDNEAYLELLRDHDFGYVHQVLSYNRRDEESRTTAYLERVISAPAADVDEVTKFGPFYLTPDEYRRRRREVTRAYYRFLGESLFAFRGREFWHYHLAHFKAMGYPISYPRVAVNGVLRLADLVLNPKRTIEGAVRRLGARLRRPSRPAVAVPVKPLTR